MEALKKQRAGLKSSLTRLINNVNGDNPDTASSNLVQVRGRRLEELTKALTDNHRLILDASPDQAEADVHQADYEVSEDRITELEVKLLDMMDKARARENPVPQQQQPVPNQQAPANPPQIQFHPSTLKKLDLPKFSGQYKDWPTFEDMFRAMVHSKGIYHDHEKLYYLKQALEENVPEILSSTSITDANYAGAWQQVTERFAHPRLLLTAQIQELLGLPHVKMESAKELRSLLDTTASVIRSVNAMQVPTDQWDPILVCIVVGRIDSESRRLWEQSLVTKDMPTFEDLRKFLTRRCEGLEALGSCERRPKSVGDSRKKSGENKSQPEERIATAADLFSGQVKGKKNELCIFCGNQHDSKDCRKAARMSLEERKKIVDDKRGCFLCLRPGHSMKHCRDGGSCILCQKRHHVLVCNLSGQVAKSVESNSSTTMSSFSSGSEVYLQTLLVRIKSHGKEKVVRALIDTGSQRSYILKSTAEATKCGKIGEEKVQHELFGGIKMDVKTHSLFLVELASMDRSFTCKIKMRDQDAICDDLPRPCAPVFQDAIKAKGIRVSDTGNGPREIEILIGGDVAGKLLLNTQQPIQLPGGPVAVQTKLGWTIMGRDDNPCAEKGQAAAVRSMMVKELSVQSLWSLDVLGIQDPLTTKSKEELGKAAKDHFLETVRRDQEGRYEVRLPWIEDHPPLPSNKNMALKRMENEVRKQKTTGDFNAYSEILQEWKTEGIIEEIPALELGGEMNQHYLPHRAVKKESSLTTKIRPVFDASAATKGNPSLNKCLEKGPNLIEIIPAIMMRFRENKIGVVSDIKKAFLQLSVHPRDRDFLRFMWPAKDGSIQIYRHRRVVFGVTSSPFLLGAVIEYHLDQASPQLSVSAEKLRKSFYVDNCVTSVGTMDEYQKFKSEATQLMEEGKMELRGWEYSGDQENPAVTSVLGMKWNKSEDSLCVDLAWLNEFQDGGRDQVTKRQILSAAHHLFDPIGIVSPVSLIPKLLIQRSWEGKFGWDEPVSAELRDQFSKWISQLVLLEKMKIPRHFIKMKVEPEGKSIHLFTDASKEAYAACVFLRAEYHEQVSVQLLLSKARVSPMELKGSIHRLELMGCVIGARLVKSLDGMLDLENVPIYCWSDSSTALTWIKKAEQWAVFVRNRVSEIRELTREEDWRHVPGIENPADLPSRGCSPKTLLDSQWWEGPTWLYEHKDKWPCGSFNLDDEEADKERLKLVKSFLVTAPEKMRSHKLTIFTHRYSRIVRVIGLIMAWRDRVRGMPVATISEPISHSGMQAEVGKPMVGQGGPESHGKATVAPEPVSHSELQAGVRISSRRAEDALLKLVQSEGFCGPDDPKLKSIVVEEEDGLMRVKTKLTHRMDSVSFKRPVVLPEIHSVVRLIIMSKHRELCHAGAPTVLRALREEFWIMHGRRAVKTVLKDCLVCRRFSAKKFVTPTPALPEKRVRDADCFEVIGVDLAGPLYLKKFPSQEEDGKKEVKAWIVLFTCAVYRAVHLELVSSLSSEKFLEAFRRFISRRGRPAVVYSDNGTNFVGAANLFKELDWSKIEGDLKCEKIQWIFNPPTAAWWGGWWERLVGIMKDILRRVLGKAHLDFEEMSTMLCECESVMNSRPLTYITEDSEDLLPLTPAMFLRDMRDDRLPEVSQATEELLTRKLRYQRKLKQDIRERFRSEYLGQLIQKRNAEKITREIKVGELVYIGQDNMKRQQWPVGKVMEIFPGKDGVKRTVRVKTATGEFLRPVQRLYPMEVTQEDQVVELSRKTEEFQQPKKKKVISRQKTEGTPVEQGSVRVTKAGRVSRKPKRLNL